MLKLPRADPVIPLLREIAKQANFTLTGKPSEDEIIIDFVYAGVEGAWEKHAPLASCKEPLPSWGSALQVTDNDSDSVVVMDESVHDDVGGSQASLSSTHGSFEDQVPPWPRTAPSHPYQPPQIMEARSGWYRGEDCFDPGEVAPEASPLQLPSQDGGLDWGGEEALLPLPADLPPYRGRIIQRAAHYSRTAKGKNGKRSCLPEETRRDRCGVAYHHFKSEAFWWQEVKESQYFPAPDQSPIHFFPAEGFGVGLKAVPYSVMVPLALEVPYLDGLAQEALQDQLVPASLYGLMVLRPAYTAEAKRPASLVATREAVDSGQGYAEFMTDTDVSASQDHNYYVGQSPECETEGTFTCHHPGCVGVEGFGAYFASSE